jgi:hypothetical protein
MVAFRRFALIATLVVVASCASEPERLPASSSSALGRWTLESQELESSECPREIALEMEGDRLWVTSPYGNGRASLRFGKSAAASTPSESCRAGFDPASSEFSVDCRVWGVLGGEGESFDLGFAWKIKPAPDASKLDYAYRSGGGEWACRYARFERAPASAGAFDSDFFIE